MTRGHHLGAAYSTSVTAEQVALVRSDTSVLGSAQRIVAALIWYLVLDSPCLSEVGFEGCEELGFCLSCGNHHTHLVHGMYFTGRLDLLCGKVSDFHT